MYSILASETKEKILHYLAKNPYVNAKKVSEGTKVNYKHAFKILKEFVDKNIVLEKNKNYYLKSEFIDYVKRFSDTLMKNYSKEFFFKNKYDLYNVLSSTYKDDSVTKKVEKIMEDWVMKKLSDWYSKFYDPEDIEYSELKKIIKQAPKRDSILELGCGTGRLTFKLARDFKNIDAIDEDESNIEYCKKISSSKKVNFLNFSAKNYKSKKKYDVILFSWMGLHYHKDYDEIIKNIQKFMHKNTTIIILDAYHETEYIEILQLIRSRDMGDVKILKENLNNYLIKKFKNFEQKVIFTKYKFPSIEELINNFRIELTLEESHIWTKEDEEKIRNYIEKKKDSLIVQEGLWLTVIKP